MKRRARGWVSVDIQPISADTSALRVSVLAFARVRELMGGDGFAFEFRHGATLRDCWAELVERFPALAPLQSSTRIAKNGRLESLDSIIEDGDEIALLPPVGGG